ncbi:MAG: hypothetical protein K2Q18_02170 [Bdellovibrionales bacterium]|nr:hypothetical protein [Bdellovibrionales bacterium]
MLKKCMTIIVLVLISFVNFGNIANAKTYKKKSRTTYDYSKKLKDKSKSKKSKSKKGKSRRYKRSGNGPDLKALTTEKTDTEYTDVPDNGVNSVETKTGL